MSVRRGKFWCRVALPVALFASTLGALPPPVDAAATGNVLRVWSPKYMDRDRAITRAQAVEEARTFDLIVAKPNAYQPYVAAMRAANPRLVLLAYFNGTFVSHKEGTAFPDAWYVRDPDGNKVRSVRWRAFMMNPAHPGWIDSRRQVCKSLVASSGYDGCSLDVLGTAPVVASGFVTGTPINPATMKPWTPGAWLTATTALATAVRTFVGRPVWGNGIGNGPRYFDPVTPSSQLLAGVSGGMAEGFLRDGRGPLGDFPTVADWRANVDMLADAGSRGRSLIVVTKVWNTGTAAQKNAWHKFALASFLLGNDGHSYFSFLYDESIDPGVGHPWWNTDLGAPTGAYALRPDGTYRRDFLKGRVLVNPSATARKVSLGATFTKLDGTRVTSLTLAPHTGEILTR